MATGNVQRWPGPVRGLRTRGFFLLAGVLSVPGAFIWWLGSDQSVGFSLWLLTFVLATWIPAITPISSVAGVAVVVGGATLVFALLLAYILMWLIPSGAIILTVGISRLRSAPNDRDAGRHPDQNDKGSLSR